MGTVRVLQPLLAQAFVVRVTWTMHLIEIDHAIAVGIEPEQQSIRISTRLQISKLYLRCEGFNPHIKTRGIVGRNVLQSSSPSQVIRQRHAIFTP